MRPRDPQRSSERAERRTPPLQAGSPPTAESASSARTRPTSATRARDPAASREASGSRPTTPLGAAPGRASGRSSSDGHWPTTRRSRSGCRRRRPSRSSARTPSARARTRARRSCGSWSWRAPPRSSLDRGVARDRDPARRSFDLLPAGLPRLPAGGGAVLRGPRRTSAQLPSLVAASALLIDYVMTVAVSTSSAVEQIVSAIPAGPERLRIEIAARLDRADHARQPARPARVGEHLRAADVPLRRAARC